MRKRRIPSIIIVVLLLAGVLAALYFMPWGFAREVSVQEKKLRMDIVSTAQSWMGCKESDGSHRAIIDLYNSHTHLARGYAVTYEDDWCATFASAVAIGCGATDIIPTECGCEPHIELFREMNCWEEADDYIPLPGDYIFYHWNCMEPGDCEEWSDHVGIVTGTMGPFIKVIEGNKDDDVSYRIILTDAPCIRGYGVPDYSA